MARGCCGGCSRHSMRTQMACCQMLSRRRCSLHHPAGKQALLTTMPGTAFSTLWCLQLTNHSALHLNVSRLKQHSAPSWSPMVLLSEHHQKGSGAYRLTDHSALHSRLMCSSSNTTQCTSFKTHLVPMELSSQHHQK